MNRDQLLRSAIEASSKAYAPYSRFRVGAALKSTDGTVFTGANVENRSYGVGICAERSAVFAAVSAGHARFSEIFIYSPDSGRPLPPCGACRQVLSEFMDSDALIHFSDSEGQIVTKTVAEMLPFDSLHDLKNEQ